MDQITISAFNRMGVFRIECPTMFERKLKKSAPLFFLGSVYKQGLLGLIIAFAEKKLRKICEIEENAIEAFGFETAESLKTGLADLRAAELIEDLPIPPYPMTLSEEACMALEFTDNWRLVFCANHTKNPCGDSGEIDWAKVRRIKILEIDNGSNDEQ